VSQKRQANTRCEAYVSRSDNRNIHK
jgi:hypothetical protein